MSTVGIGLLSVGLILGGIDRICGNRFGIGESFEQGFMALGPLALGMVGMMCIAPVLARLLSGVIVPLYQMFHIDPSMFASIFANDMGGYYLSKELCLNKEIGMYAGLIVSSMLGCTLIFSMPVGFSMLEENKHEAFCKGLLIGFIALPFGCIAGGVMYGLNLVDVLRNTSPVLLVSILIILSLKKNQERTIHACMVFAKGIQILSYIGLCIAAFTYLTHIVILQDMLGILEAMEVVSKIGIMLLAVYPTITFLLKVFNQPLEKLCKHTRYSKDEIAGLLFATANAIPVFTMMNEMEDQGVVLNTAWIVCATSCFGAHFAFTSSIDQAMVQPLLVGKIFGGIVSIGLCLLMKKKTN